MSEGEFEWAALYREIMASEYRGTFNLELKPPSKLNDKAKKAYYLLAYETARTIMGRCNIQHFTIEKDDIKFYNILD